MPAEVAVLMEQLTLLNIVQSTVFKFQTIHGVVAASRKPYLMLFKQQEMTLAIFLWLLLAMLVVMVLHTQAH